MKRLTVLKNVFFIAVIALNSYAIVEGFRKESYIGVILATGSLVALTHCIRLFKKMENGEAEEEMG